MKSTCMLLALLLAPAAVAQVPPANTIPVMIGKYRVKPGHVRTFEELMKSYSEAFKKEGRAFHMVWRTFMGDQYEFISMAAIPGLETFDRPGPLGKALGEGRAAEWGMRLAQCIDGVTRQVWHIHPEQSIWSEQNFRGARVTELSLRSGSALTEHNRAQTKVAAKMKETGRKNYWLLHLDYRGDDYRLLSITPFEKYADARAGSLSALVGAEESKKIVAMREQVTASRHVYLWGYRRDLSFRTSELVTSQ